MRRDIRHTSANPEWLQLWEERGRVVKSVFGETEPPDMVTPFSWDDYILPGACSMCFPPTSQRDCYTYMTLGLTQPVKPGESCYPYEFCIRTKNNAQWPHQLLYDLTTYWLSAEGSIEKGLYLPMTLFHDQNKSLCAGLTDQRDELSVIGQMRGLFLWNDQENHIFKVSSDNFSLLSAVLVTDDEDELAQQKTPPHLLLLLCRMGVNQISNPMRQSVLSASATTDEWQRIQSLSHDEAIDSLRTAWPNL